MPRPASTPRTPAKRAPRPRRPPCAGARAALNILIGWRAHAQWRGSRCWDSRFARPAGRQGGGSGVDPSRAPPSRSGGGAPARRWRAALRHCRYATRGTVSLSPLFCLGGRRAGQGQDRSQPLVAGATRPASLPPPMHGDRAWHAAGSRAAATLCKYIPSQHTGPTVTPSTLYMAFLSAFDTAAAGASSAAAAGPDPAAPRRPRPPPLLIARTQCALPWSSPRACKRAFRLPPHTVLLQIYEFPLPSFGPSRQRTPAARRSAAAAPVFVRSLRRRRPRSPPYIPPRRVRAPPVRRVRAPPAPQAAPRGPKRRGPWGYACPACLYSSHPPHPMTEPARLRAWHPQKAPPEDAATFRSLSRSRSSAPGGETPAPAAPAKRSPRRRCGPPLFT